MDESPDGKYLVNDRLFAGDNLGIFELGIPDKKCTGPGARDHKLYSRASATMENTSFTPFPRAER